MNTRAPKLTDILFPPAITSDPRRDAATRTILQPDIDLFEQSENDFRRECPDGLSTAAPNRLLRLVPGAYS